jgi:predicted permease
MGAFIGDLRYSLRTLRKSPVFLAIAVLSLGLGIGANAAIFTLVNQLILAPLPVQHPEQIVMLAGRGKHYGGNNGSERISYPMYHEIRDQNKVFSGMFCTYPTFGGVSATFGGTTEMLGAEFVSGNFCPVLGVGAAAGRVFNASDDLYRGNHPLVVLSYRYWQSRFGGDPSIVNKQMTVNGRALTIIGVSAAGFDGVEPGRAPQIRIPITMVDDLPRSNFERLSTDRLRWAEVFGRLKPGVTLQQAQAGLQPLFHQLLGQEVKEPAFAKASPQIRSEFLKMWMEVMPGSTGRSNLRKTYAKPLFALMGVVGLVLLIACSNLANLLIARASARQKEIAIRLARGAPRGSIVRQLLIECMVLSMAGGTLGLGLAVAIDRELIHFLPTGRTPVSLTSTPDFRVLAFTFGISLLAGLLFGLAPAMQSTRPDVAGTLKDEAGAVLQGGSARLRKCLVVGQVALALVLLIGAELFLESLRNLKTLNPGFNTANLVAFGVDATLTSEELPRNQDYYRRLDTALRNVPGVQSHSFAVVPLIDDNEWDNWITIEGYTAKPDERPDAHMQFCSPGYFKTLGIPLLMGRDFDQRDVKDAPKVMIANQKFVKKFFGTAYPIGRHIGMGIDPGTKTDIEIVGVVGDTKYESLREEIPEELYQPIPQRGYASSWTVYARTTGNPEPLFSALRKAVRDVDSDVPLQDMRTLEEQVEISLASERLLATLSSVFGGLASLLAALGLYGVMAFMVGRRTREIGIRMALGAGQDSVMWMVVRETLTLAGIGVAIGLGGAYAVARLIQAQLYGVAPADPLILAAASLGIVVITALAGFIPARRATRIDPMTALRWE